MALVMYGVFPILLANTAAQRSCSLSCFFLVVLGLPIMVMEFAMGRASYRSIARSFDVLEPRGSKWHRFKWLGLVGCYLLMMFYTVVCGWTLAYFLKTATGELSPTADVAAVFNNLTGRNPFEMTGWMLSGHGGIRVWRLRSWCSEGY